MYIGKGEYERAEPLLQRSLAIYEKAFGVDSVNTAAPLNNLALLYSYKGDYKQAELFGLRALAINEKGFGPEHIEVAASLSLLGTLYSAKGEYNRGEALLQRALSINQKVFGPNHPRVALSLANLAALYLSKGDIQQAVSFLTRALETRERNLWLITFSGSDREKRAYLEALFPEIYAAVSLHVLTAQSNALASQLAFTTILRYKGRSLDAMSFATESLRHSLNQQDHSLLERLSVAQSQLAKLVFNGPKNMPSEEYATAAMHLEVQVEQLQDAISRRSAEFRVLAEPITLEQVSQVVPEDGALVEFFSYKPFNIKSKTLGDRFGAPRYVAYILRHNDASPKWVELGETTNIDALVEQLRPALRDPRRKDFKRLARTLDERLMRPIRKLLGPTRHIFLAPDGALNLIPFASLVDENGQYLIENYSINYLTSGRDLLRLQVKGESREAPRVFADPLYDLSARAQPGLQSPQTASSPAAPNTNHQRSKDFSDFSYRPLPGTAAEAAALNKLFPDATLFIQAGATETALKKVNRPRFLHIATHGFFLADQTEPTTSQTLGARSELGIDTEPLVAVNRENPLLRSGLILAGVKQQASGPGEDGVLTALEVAGLDLWGTKLVVLSACETGLGDVKDGEGVYGLRRALVLAGSETQVMSLWKVSDAGTRDLMVAYYMRLKRGEERMEALRQAQLAMLRGQLLPVASGRKRETSDTGGKETAKDYRHPYYWAAFIPSGDWRSIDGK
jgi:CHAT domain-containing protein